LVPTAQQVRRTAFVLVICGILGAAFLPPRHGPRVAAAPPPIVVPVTLTWGSGGTGTYRVEILSGRRVVYRTVTRSHQLRVPQRLGPARYTWRVLAITGVGAGGRATLRVIDHGWFLSKATGA
jgi:hypothetical protein